MTHTPVRAANLPPAAQPRSDSIVVLWNRALLQGVRDAKLGPPYIVVMAPVCGTIEITAASGLAGGCLPGVGNRLVTVPAADCCHVGLSVV